MSNALCCRKWIDFAYKSSESLEYVKYSPEYFEYEESLKYALSRVTRDVNREFLSLFFLFIYSFSEESNNDIRVLRANNLFIIFPRRVLFVYNIRTTQAFFFLFWCLFDDWWTIHFDDADIRFVATFVYSRADIIITLSSLIYMYIFFRYHEICRFHLYDTSVSFFFFFITDIKQDINYYYYGISAVVR